MNNTCNILLMKLKLKTGSFLLTVVRLGLGLNIVRAKKLFHHCLLQQFAVLFYILVDSIQDLDKADQYLTLSSSLAKKDWQSCMYNLCLIRGNTRLLNLTL